MGNERRGHEPRWILEGECEAECRSPQTPLPNTLSLTRSTTERDIASYCLNLLDPNFWNHVYASARSVGHAVTS